MKKGLIKLALSLAMIGIILHYIDARELGRTLRSLPPATAIGITFAYLLGQLISAFKWWRLALASGISVSFRHTLKSYFIGMFVNCFGLGMVGGDVARGILLARGKPLKTAGVSTVIADRVQGLATLALIGMIAVVIFGPGTIPYELIVALFGVGTGLSIGWFIGPPCLTWIVRRDPLPRARSIVNKLLQVANSFPRKRRALVVICVVSAVFHLLQIGMHRAMGLGLGVEIPWAYLLVIVPFVNIFSSLPIGWNGLGIRESAYIFFLTPAILSREQAVAFGAMWLLAVTFSSAIGGVVAFLSEDFSLLRASSEKVTPPPQTPGLAPDSK